MLVRRPQPSARSVLTRLHMLGAHWRPMHGGSGLRLAARVSLSLPAVPGPCLFGSGVCGPRTFGCSPAWGLLQQQAGVRMVCAHAASCLHRTDRHMLSWSGACGEG